MSALCPGSRSKSKNGRGATALARGLFGGVSLRLRPFALAADDGLLYAASATGQAALDAAACFDAACGGSSLAEHRKATFKKLSSLCGGAAPVPLTAFCRALEHVV